jgi:uncharacterized protein (TIGR03435 family)
LRFAWRRLWIDQTGLKGDYDFKLAYTMNLPPNLPQNAMVNGQPIDTSGPSIFRRRGSHYDCGSNHA